MKEGTAVLYDGERIALTGPLQSIAVPVVYDPLLFLSSTNYNGEPLIAWTGHGRRCASGVATSFARNRLFVPGFYRHTIGRRRPLIHRHTIPVCVQIS